MDPFFRRRRFGIFGGDFDDIFERIQDEMRRMMEESLRLSELDEKEIERLARMPNTKVYGFSVRIGSDGKPIVREFGNWKPGIEMKGLKALEEGERSPLVDVIDDKGEIVVIAEVPGVEKKEINLHATETELEINVENPERKYYRKVDLPKEVIPESSKATYKNGVLEVRLKKKKMEDKKVGKPIKIE
ncbi:MAG: archaeal heat shock protein Hsp20 [Candidatus Anstonellales archaeon]